MNFGKYKKAYPEKATELERRFNHTLADGVLDALPTFVYGSDKADSTRKFSMTCLNAVAPGMPELMGGSADLIESNYTHIKGSV